MREKGREVTYKLHKILFVALVVLLPTQLGRHFWPNWSYVLGLKIDYLAPTVYLTDILVLLILGLWGWEKFKVQSSKFKITPKKFLTKLTGQVTQNLKLLTLPISIFLLLLVNSLLAQNPGAALYKFVKIIEFGLLGFYVAKNHYQLLAISYQLSFVVIYSSLIALVQFVLQASIGGPFWWLGERTFSVATPGIAKAIVGGRLVMRPYAIFSHPNVLAGFLLVSLVLVGSRCQALGFRKGFRWLAMFLGVMAIIISFSRSVWLVGLLIGLWVLLKTPPRWLACRMGKANALLGGGGVLLLVVSGAVLLFKLPLSTKEAISQRLQLAQTAISMVKASPLIGVGLNNFLVRLPDFWQTPGTIRWLQPVHNIFLLIAAEAGLVGLVIFLWFLFLTYQRLFKSPSSSRLTPRPTTHNPLLIPLSAIFLLGLFDHYWLTLQQTQLLLSLVLGLSWGYNERNEGLFYQTRRGDG